MPNATMRANARTMSAAKRRPPTDDGIIDDLAFLPDRYALPVLGDCLSPEIRDGEMLLFDKALPYRIGDLVVLFRRREATPNGKLQALVKRLIMLPSFVTFPWRDHPESDVVAFVAVEQLNPHRRFTLPCADLLGIHKCLGVEPPDLGRVACQPPTDRRALVGAMSSA
jgi:hypothetical protein